MTISPLRLLTILKKHGELEDPTRSKMLRKCVHQLVALLEDVDMNAVVNRRSVRVIQINLCNYALGNLAGTQELFERNCLIVQSIFKEPNEQRLIVVDSTGTIQIPTWSELLSTTQGILLLLWPVCE